MRLFNSRKLPASVDPLHRLSQDLDSELQAACSRYEPEEFAARRVPVDPYLEWTAQREAEREDSTSVRWVYRHEDAGGTAFAH
jgi:hypothetical protein